MVGDKEMVVVEDNCPIEAVVVVVEKEVVVMEDDRHPTVFYDEAP